jgi:hypothetical protein
MVLICVVSIAINVGGLPFISKIEAKGKAILELESKYLVDFSDGVKKYNLVGKPSDYKRIFINRKQCIKE